MKATIAGLGQWLPERTIGNDAWPPEFSAKARAASNREFAETPVEGHDAYEQLMQRRVDAERGDPFLATVRRHVADEAMTACEAEALAGRAALEDARLWPEDVDLVLSSSGVPDRITPANAARVAHLVGAKGAGAIGIDVSCASVCAQVAFGAALIETGRAKTVLCTQSHLITRIHPLMYPASPLMGDAATALVLRAGDRPGFLGSTIVSHGDYWPAVTWARGREVDPPWWKEGGPYVLGSLDPQATMRLPQQWIRMAVDTITSVVRGAGRNVEDIDVIASVQPRRWLPSAICEALGLPEKTAPLTWDEIAHVGACGVVSNLMRARDEGALRPGARVVFYGMGAGVTRAAAFFVWGA